MHRIDDPSKAADLFGTGKDGFTGGDSELMIDATVLTPDWANSQQEEVARAVEAMGVLDKTQHDQLLRSIRAHAEISALAALRQSAAAAIVPTTGSAIATDDATTIVCVSGDPIRYSLDCGRTWAASAIDVTNVRAVAWGAGLFVAVGAGEIYTSLNGVTWTARTPAASYAEFFSHVYYAEQQSLWVAIGNMRVSDAPHEVQTSPDGITWTRRTDFPARATPDNTAASFASAASREDLLAIAVQRDIFLSTDDGESWEAPTLASAPAADTKFFVVATPGGIYAISTAVGTNGPYAWREPRAGEGSSWVRVELPIGLDFSGAKLRGPHVDPYTGLLTISSLTTAEITPPDLGEGDLGTYLWTAFSAVVPYPYQEKARVVARNCLDLKRARAAFVGVAVKPAAAAPPPLEAFIHVAGPLGF